jgi:hypothetical protein
MVGGSGCGLLHAGGDWMHTLHRVLVRDSDWHGGFFLEVSFVFFRLPGCARDEVMMMKVNDAMGRMVIMMMS